MTALAAGFSSALAVALLVPSWVEREHKESVKDWYDKHIKANIVIAPPSIVFHIAWTITYIFMAIAIGLWSQQPDMSSGTYIGAWVLIVFNILFNKLWTVLFFSFRDMKWSIVVALVDALLLFATAVAVVVLFHLSPDKNAAVFVLWYLYVLWTAFILVLNFAIWLCNREGGLGIDYTPLQ